MTVRRVLAVFGGVVAVIAMAALGAFVALFAPVFLDDRALDRIVAVVALDWRDFGREKAHERLLLELDKNGIGPWVGDSDCQLLTESELRIVSCSWETVVHIPLVDERVPLWFESSAAMDDAGEFASWQ
ncbi:MAG: hypothetical protein ACJAZO_003165 [Myxococcota bacterium]|jgi:hypothetical protein